jgi:Tol biopolymer transport system component
MRADGSDLRQITSGEGIHSNPSVTPDGNWIFYMNERGGQSSGWRVAADGTGAEQIVDESSFPRVSPDGKYFACGFSSNGEKMLAIFPIDGGEPVKLLEVPKTHNFTNAIRWKPDGKSITYRDWANGIWKQSVEGGEPHRVAGLPEEKLMTYGWSRNGKYLAFTRGKQSLDAVLITDFR